MVRKKSSVGIDKNFYLCYTMFVSSLRKVRKTFEKIKKISKNYVSLRQEKNIKKYLSNVV
jgi:hypothetical protein